MTGANLRWNKTTVIALTAFVLLTACGTPLVADEFAAARYVPEREDDLAFENDRVAFRIYGPALRDSVENSGVDCWLKRVDYPIIDKWYAGAAQGISYHKDHGEGYDPYKVGDSLGCGGLALWIDGKLAMSNVYQEYRIIENGPRRAVFEVKYAWEGLSRDYRETRTFTLDAGSQLFRADSQISVDGRPAQVTVAIGIATHGSDMRQQSDDAGRWVSHWGLIDDAGLGTGAVVLHQGRGEIVRLEKKGKKGFGHTLVVTPTDEDGRIRYYAGFAWEKAGQITDADAWCKYLDEYPTPK